MEWTAPRSGSLSASGVMQALTQEKPGKAVSNPHGAILDNGGWEPMDKHRFFPSITWTIMRTDTDE